jgi:transcriptional regulator
MYQPPHFREDDVAVQHALIRAHPLGLLISNGPSGLLANPIPFLVDPTPDGPGTLRCHVARANLQWQELESVAPCLVVFQGPQDYVTPSWYATKRETGKVVPTWNYATVHCWGTARVIHDEAWIRRQIGDLTNSREGRRAAPWKVEDAPPEFTRAQIRAIVGIEIPIARIEGKWKMSQNRNEADRRGVVAGYRADDHAGMAAIVAERNGMDGE